ncbi:hypothetical protein Tco_0039704 [Tanacetum coccineum]
MISWSPPRPAYLMGRAIFSWIYKVAKEPYLLHFCRHSLQNTNFFRAFNASTNVPSIYIQQFWNTLTQEAKSGVMDFVNELGYPEVIHFVSKMHVNNLYQPWRAMLTLINQCLTSKTSGKLLWEEFVQGIQTFFSHRASLSIPSKKSTPHVIPYFRFTKMIIYYLGSRHNIHRRPESPMHVTGDDFPLVNLKFVPKGKKDEVFGMPYNNPQFSSM